MMKASSFLMPNLCSHSNKKVSNTVNATPQISGKPVSKLIPIAIPNTSAKSQAAMANSASMYKQKFTTGGYTSLLACAKSLRLTIPSLALKLCNSSAIKLLINNTQISL